MLEIGWNLNCTPLTHSRILMTTTAWVDGNSPGWLSATTLPELGGWESCQSLFCEISEEEEVNENLFKIFYNIRWHEPNSKLSVKQKWLCGNIWDEVFTVPRNGNQGNDSTYVSLCQKITVSSSPLKLMRSCSHSFNSANQRLANIIRSCCLDLSLRKSTFTDQQVSQTTLRGLRSQIGTSAKLRSCAMYSKIKQSFVETMLKDPEHWSNLAFFFMACGACHHLPLKS